MDSGLFWSAPAKRRGQIDSRRWKIPTAFVRNLDGGSHTRRDDGAFPSPHCPLCRHIQSGGGQVLPGWSWGDSGLRGFRQMSGNDGRRTPKRPL